jgi:hypothetical protein
MAVVQKIGGDMKSGIGRRQPTNASRLQDVVCFT